MAGVSVATVSRHYTKHGCVNPGTSESITSAAERLGYRHKTRKTASLAPQSKSVLVICGDIGSQIYVQYIRGIQTVLRKEDYNVLIVDSCYNSDEEEYYLRYAEQHKYSGAIMLNVMESANITGLIQSLTIPVVFVNRYINTIDVDIIGMDNYRCGYISTQHLIDAGHRKIAHLAGPRDSIASSERRRGYVDCLSANDLGHDEKNIFWGNLRPESGIDFARRILDGKYDITAVYSANDLMAETMANELIENDCRVPDEISIVCTDNTPAAVSGKVKLTSVFYDSFEIGIVAGNTFLERIKDPSQMKKRIMYCPTIILRDSVRDISGESE